MSYYAVRDTTNRWFTLYLENRTQFVSIDSYSSDLDFTCFSVPQGSILGQLSLLNYINDWYCTIKYCIVHSFAGDTNLLNFNHSIKKMNKQVNYDLKNINNWLNAKKSWIIIKLKLFFLNHKKKKKKKKKWMVTYTLSWIGSISSEQIQLNKYLQYWRDHLTWCHQINNVAAKLNRANAILSKIRHFVKFKTLTPIYHALFIICKFWLRMLT